jgi:hypothetical protein
MPIAIGINATPFGRSSFTTQFQRDGNPQFATCGRPGATVANFNFHFVPAP